MSKQSEAILEEQLVAQLKMLGYQYALINSEKDLILNLKSQLEKHTDLKVNLWNSVQIFNFAA